MFALVRNAKNDKLIIRSRLIIISSTLPSLDPYFTVIKCFFGGSINALFMQFGYSMFWILDSIETVPRIHFHFSIVHKSIKSNIIRIFELKECCCVMTSNLVYDLFIILSRYFSVTLRLTYFKKWLKLLLTGCNTETECFDTFMIVKIIDQFYLIGQQVESWILFKPNSFEKHSHWTLLFYFQFSFHLVIWRLKIWL